MVTLQHRSPLPDARADVAFTRVTLNADGTETDGASVTAAMRGGTLVIDLEAGGVFRVDGAGPLGDPLCGQPRWFRMPKAAASSATVGLVNDPDLVRAAVAAVAAALPSAARPAAAGVVSALGNGVRSTCIALLGDSTGTDLGEWFGELGKRLGLLYPEFTVRWRPWNTTSGEYDSPDVSPDIQAGSANGGGLRGAQLASGGLSFAAPAVASTDLDVRAKLMSGNYAPGGGASATIVSRFDTSAANRSWFLAITDTGLLNLQWSPDGTTVLTAVSTVALPFASGQAGWIRATLDIDNGAAGRTVTFFTSADGATWTALGSPVISAGVTTLFASTTAFRAGCRNVTASDFFAGTIYWVEVKYGTLGSPQPSVVPPIVDDWQRVTGVSTVTFVGAPVLLMLSGSASGQNIAYWNDATRRALANSPHGQGVLFLSSIHNEASSSYVSSLAAWVTDLKARVPSVPLVIVSQNPVKLGSAVTSLHSELDRAWRAERALAYAATQAGVYVMDTRRAFDGADLAAAIDPDGIHPTPVNSAGTSGSDLWVSFVVRAMLG